MIQRMIKKCQKDSIKAINTKQIHQRIFHPSYEKNDQLDMLPKNTKREK